MSRKRQITVTCPECKHESPFVIWDSINTTLNPEMKEAVLDKSAFLFECPECYKKTYVDYGFLYHQMDDKIMIHYANSDENAEEVYNMLTGNDPAGVMEDFRQHDYLIRVVRSQNELIDKIRVFDAGLDDRIIEIFKLYVYVTFLKDNSDCREIETLFYRDDGKNYVQINADGKYQGISEMQDDMYSRIADEYEKALPDIRKDGPYIDRQWALDMIQSKE